jgi:L-alanine-DL-glutamate epimerase-like enolase superfamily enzyme
MPLTTDVDRHDLSLDVPFEISRGPATTEKTVFTVEVTDEQGRTGVGGAAPADYYDETPTSCDRALEDLARVLRAETDPTCHQRLERRFRAVAPDEGAALAAVSIAIHDLAARRTGEPLFRRWGHDPAAAPRTCLSIGIADPDVMAERATAAIADGFDTLKLKLGTDADRERVEAVRAAVPTATIRVDANGAWAPDEAVAATEWLAEADVEFVEQPVPADDVAGLDRVRRAGAVPVAADEACVTAADVPSVAPACDVVVVKLMKVGGLRAARRQIYAAQAHDCEVMLGCMVETNASIAAACHLAPLVDYADLDGSLLLAADPYDGVPLPGGEIDLEAVADLPGTGVVRR